MTAPSIARETALTLTSAQAVAVLSETIAGQRKRTIAVLIDAGLFTPVALRDGRCTEYRLTDFGQSVRDELVDIAGDCLSTPTQRSPAP